MRNIIILFILSVSTLLSATDIKILQAHKIRNSPVIDGSLQDNCWGKAEKAADFTLNVNSKSPAKMPTSFSVLYDQNNLYFGIECQEEMIKELKKDCVKHDGAIYADDCVEIFIDANIDRQTYFHFMVNPAAIKAEWDFKNKAWNPPWQAAVVEKEKSWTIEIAIPFAELGIKGTDGTLLRFNVCRARRPGAMEYTCWSNTGGSFHAPGRFGWLTLGSYKDSIKCNFIPAMKQISGEYDKLLKNSGETGVKLKKQLAKICKPLLDFENNEHASVEDFIKLQHTLTRLKNFIYEIKLNLLFNNGQELHKK